MARLPSEASRIESENLSEAREFFSQQFLRLEAPRRAQGLRYPLPLVVTSALFAVVAGADDAQAIEYWSCANEDFLAEFLDMPHGIPTQDVYLSVFASLCPEQFESVFRSWVNLLKVSQDGSHIAIDGKSSRGSGAGSSLSLHSLNAFLVDAGLVLAQKSSDKKEGEINAIPELLKKLDLKNCTVTLDAIGCQRKIAQAIVSGGGQYFLQVKGNQPQLQKDAELLFDTSLNIIPVGDDADHPTHTDYEEVDKGHGRVETRRVYVSDTLSWISAPEDWCGVQNLIRIDRERFDVKTQKTSKVTAYHISSIEGLSPERALNLSRRHWAVENELHWVLDVAFGEDHATHRAQNAAANLSLLRKWALNLIKTHKSRRGGVKNSREIAGWDRNYLLDILKDGRQRN